jgi:Mg-chelatase subunit ChlI
MKENRIEQGRFTENAHGLGTVTEAMVRRRAEEIAIINGRSKHQVNSTDLDQARRELTGEERLTPEPTAAEQLPEEKRWEAVPESTGEKAPTVPAPDEQSFAEKLVEEGVEDAEHEQMIEATREDLKRERRP